MRRTLSGPVKFIVGFYWMTIVCTIVWEVLVAGKLYDCTDPGFFGYLTPGDWVHAWGGRPVLAVPQIIPGRSMSDPDVIKEGWTVMQLWFLWSAFFASSVVVGLVFAWLPWLSRPLFSAKRSSAK